jgi:hypothetical protein
MIHPVGRVPAAVGTRKLVSNKVHGAQPRIEASSERSNPMMTKYDKPQNQDNTEQLSLAPRCCQANHQEGRSRERLFDASPPPPSRGCNHKNLELYSSLREGHLEFSPCPVVGSVEAGGEPTRS